MNRDAKLRAYEQAEALAGVGHWVIEPASKSLYWSDQVYQLHGLDPATYTPTLDSAIQLYHPSDRDRVQNYVAQSIEDGQDFSFSLRIIRPDSSIRYVKAHAQCEKDTVGHLLRVVGIFQDVTEEVDEREAYDRTRAAHESLIDATKDGYWDWRIQDNYEYMSPRFWDMFGYKPEEKQHSPSAWQDMIFEEDLIVALDNFQKHVDSLGEHPYEQEVRYRHKDGSTVTVECRGRVVEWDENKQPIRMIGTHTDISGHKKAEGELRATLNFHRLLMNANTDLVFVKDEQFKIVDANDAFLSLYPNKTLNDIVGTTTIEDYNAAEAAEFLKHDKSAFTDGLSEVAETILFPDGRKRTLLTKKMRFENREGKQHILGVARDITSLRNTEQALIKANDELKEFSYRTSHDLRSPLISSRSLLNIIIKRLNNDEVKEIKSHLQLIDKTLEQLESLVTDILSISKLSHSDVPNVSIDFEKLIDESRKKLAHMEGFSRVSFKTDLSQLTTPFETSIIHITHIVENLISNSIKYQRCDQDDTCVSITASVTDRHFKFSVSDNGIGIPVAYRNDIFSMFKRFHPKVAYGSGLGLYMVKKNVTRLKGTIEYTPLDKGSCFTVTIPLNDT